MEEIFCNIISTGTNIAVIVPNRMKIIEYFANTSSHNYSIVYNKDCTGNIMNAY